jgi:hypothetical protein
MQGWWIRFISGLVSIALVAASVAAGCEKPMHLKTPAPHCCSVTPEIQAVTPQSPARPEPPRLVSTEFVQTVAVVAPQPPALNPPAAHNLRLMPHRPSFVVLHAFLI